MENGKNLQIYKDQIHELIQESNRILLTTHENPDGDGLGSQIAMYNHIKNLNKECRIINISKLPDKYNFLNSNNEFETFDQSQLEWIEESDLTIVFDIGHSIRVGEMHKYIFSDKKSLSIDHHPIKDNEPFTYTWVDITAPATGYMVWDLLKNDDLDLFDSQSATGLYTALVTDTGSFRYSNTNADCHKMASHLIESGVKPQEVTTHVYESRKLLHIQLLGDALNGMQFVHDKKVAWVKLDNKQFSSRKANSSDIEGFADFVRSIENVEIAFTMIEDEDGQIKLSFRSQGNYIVNDVAKQFGGGGHKYAAGAKVNSLKMEELEKEILSHIERKF